MSQEYYTVCIQGHRPNTCYSYNYDDYVWCEFDDYIDTYLKTLFREAKAKGVKLKIITGGALGVDQKVALNVIRLKKLGYPIELCLYLPCKHYELSWPVQKSRDTLNSIREQCDYVTWEAEEYEQGCLDDRSKHMVDDSDCILSFCLTVESGTYKTIRYARKKGIECIIVHPFTFEIRTDI